VVATRTRRARHWLEAVAQGSGGGTTIVAGVGGVGKTRLVGALSERAARQGWTVTVGRAYPVETGVPYAVFADALTTVLRGLTPAALAVLTRGDGATLANLCPAFAPGPALPGAREGGGDVKARLHWSFAQFLGQLAAQRPVLMVLENLQWADTARSSSCTSSPADRRRARGAPLHVQRE
jgi:predicted ATPase